MSSPLLWGPNNTSNNLQNQILLANGEVLSNNGPKNYIKGGFETGTTAGWSLFTTTLTTKIPTGTISAGASSLSFGVTSTAGNTLNGNYSLVVAAASSWTAGQGLISNTFTVDQEDKAKVLSFSFSYKNEFASSVSNFSGTSSNTLAVYIYDVTNAQWIQPAGVYNLIQNSGVGRATGTFQTSANGTDYQLAVLSINSTTGTGDVIFDSFFVGPQTTSVGPAIGSMKQFTASGTWTANAAYTGFYQRVGDFALLDYRIDVTGTPTSTTLYVNMPPGMTIDTSKQIGEAYFGQGTILSNGVNRYKAVGSIDGAANRILIAYENWVSTTNNPVSMNAAVTQNLPVVFKNTDVITMRISVPVVGWDTNTVQSADTDTRVVAASYSGTNDTSVAASATENIPFKTKQVDTHSAYNTSTATFTVPISGIYQINSQILVNDGASVVARTLSVVVDGAIKFSGSGDFGSASVSQTVVVSGQCELKAGSEIKVQYYNGYSGGAAAVSDSAGTYLTIQRLSGPAVVQASETVACSYGSSAGNSIAHASFRYLDFSTKILDTHNAVVGAGSGNNATATNTWRFVVPVSGTYQVNAGFGIVNGSTSANLDIFATICVNAVGAIRGTRSVYPTTTFSGAYNSIASSIVKVKAGDYISIAAYQANGDSATRNQEASETTNYINIVRVGN